MGSVNAGDLERLFEEVESAVLKELEAVRERPASEVLAGGQRTGKKHDEKQTDYRFESANVSLRYAEECRALFQEEVLTVHPVESTDDAIVLRFPGDYGEQIPEIELEWENDFVLRRVHEALEELKIDRDRRDRILRMLEPKGVRVRKSSKSDIRDDGHRNHAQRMAIEKALRQPVSFLWGPPGTGKTATLAYVMANFMLRGKSVLFVSNTNRAVDHGMLGLMEAMEVLQMRGIEERITRFGDRVLDSPRLESIHFDHQLDALLRASRQAAADLQHWLDARHLPDLSNVQDQLITEKIAKLGGEEAIEERIEELLQGDRSAYLQLRRYRVVGTTLARVCTSELLERMDFDAVVVDEASMANLPYMLIMASRARDHLVIAGDPMQLPPIAQTADPVSRKVLEQDVFALVSGAGAADGLFRWHDRNQSYTSFFHTQYRMQPGLARVISEVFYEGRLESASETENGKEMVDHPVQLIDTSFLKPVLTQQDRRRGFQPVNETHRTVLEDLIRKLLTVYRYRLRDMGIIVPFRSSVWHLRRELKAKNRWTELEIGTIHTFQGREKRVMILDTVMSGEMRGGSAVHYPVRPFDETRNGLAVPRLLNVAFSRSRERLYVLADMQHMRRVYQGKFLDRLLHRLPLRDDAF